jgi:hypothetical protein
MALIQRLKEQFVDPDSDLNIFFANLREAKVDRANAAADRRIKYGKTLRQKRLGPELMKSPFFDW